ncbi:MAG: DUF2279 domain-containing protein [Gammaproteobacteria bacterium]|nr:DUF2279 domain-containing protein [Gammaproteobacteria bacterium]
MPNRPQLLAVILSLCAMNLISCTAKPLQSGGAWFAKDKAAHFATSATLAAGLAVAAKDKNQHNCDAALFAFSFSLAIGAGKESYDKRSKKTQYSYRDMVWNTAGATVGSLLATNCH